MTVRSRQSAAGRLLVVCLLVSACASPIRAVRVDREEAHRDVSRSAITTGEISWASRDVLLERGLLDDYQARPDRALRELHRLMIAENASPDLLFALAELSYLFGEASDNQAHQLAAAVYAYAMLFPGSGEVGVDAFDPRFRLAADLYNWGLTSALASADDEEVVPRGGRFGLPFGYIDVAFDPADLRTGDRLMFEFIPVAELEVEGLAARYRWPGIGAPLAASTRKVAEDQATFDMVAPKLKVPVTALLRIPDARTALLSDGSLNGSLELHLAWDSETVTIDDAQVPLESEPTAALALTFSDISVLDLEIFAFLGRLAGVERKALVSSTPYQPGLVPLVFVHGTASSPLRWAELFNRLQADPELRSRYQFWFFQYDSDNPIALSSLRLRQSLSDAVRNLDPEGKDPALREMVLIGHSQGGLLVKMQVIDSGDRLWNAVSNKPIDELRLHDETREVLSKALFVEPLPEVSRVIFVATPHRGSFLAASTLVTNLVRRLTVMPAQFTAMSLDIARNIDASKSPFMPTAVDNMSPHSPFIRGLQQIDHAPSVRAHSIIAVKEGMEPIEEGNDGVVEYTSAHIDGVDSQIVVRSPHSCQGNPDTMEEVRRILRLHVSEMAETAGR